MGDVRAGLDWLRRLARRGRAAAPVEPSRRRLLLLQIDGLSSERLVRALAGGTMPHLAARLASGSLSLKRLRTATAPSTPVHQAALLYGTAAGIPGFGWHDRALGRTVRMDLAEDVAAVEEELTRLGGPSLLAGGVSYGTLFVGRARDAFFNLVCWGSDAPPPLPRPRLHNLFDRLASLATGATIAGHVAARFGVELSAGALDLWRFFRRQRTTRFEWRYLYMRLFVSVILRDVATHGAVLDVLRGEPTIYADYFGYDETAHRRGPDSLLAFYNLRGVDEAIERIARAAESVPEYRYDLFVISDHGQSATTPFERLVGEELGAFVLRHAGPAPTAADVRGDDIRALVRIRAAQLWSRTLSPPLHASVALYLAWLARGVERRLRAARLPAEVTVVTGGSIAHVYLDGQPDPRRLDEIERGWPHLVGALTRCEAVGLIVARARGGPVVLVDGKAVPLADRARLARLPPFRAVGVELLAGRLAEVAASPRSGDLVLFGAFARAGNVAFDFELGSHGGVHPDELDCFLIHPSDVAVPLDGVVRAEELHRFFRARYVEPGRRAKTTRCAS